MQLLPAGQALLATAYHSSRVPLEQQHALEVALSATPWTQAGVPQGARAAEPEVISAAQWDGLMAPYRRHA